MNEYQQLLYMAMALVEEKDLTTIFRAMRHHPERNWFVDLVNEDLDAGRSLWQAFEEPSALHKAMTFEYPEFSVRLWDGNCVLLDVGFNDQESHMIEISARIDKEGKAYEVKCDRYWPGGAPGGFTEPLNWRAN